MFTCLDLSRCKHTQMSILHRVCYNFLTLVLNKMCNLNTFYLILSTNQDSIYGILFYKRKKKNIHITFPSFFEVFLIWHLLIFLLKHFFFNLASAKRASFTQSLIFRFFLMKLDLVSNLLIFDVTFFLLLLSILLKCVVKYCDLIMHN